MKYIFSRIFNMNFKRFFRTIKEVHKISGKNRIYLFFDIIICAFKYKSGYVDYLSFGFYDLNRKQRKTYLTRGKNNKYVALLNKKDKWHLFDNKNEFNYLFNRYLNRKWLYLNDNVLEFKKMFVNSDELIVKPNNNSGGIGVEKINIHDFNSMDDLYNHLVNKKQLLVEEVIKQHKDLNVLYPKSVNTLRIITVRQGARVDIVTAFLRIGNGGVVDNTCSGGMLTMIDLETGKTLYPACDAALNIFEKHPITGTLISGFTIPYWEECLNFVKKLAIVVDDINYVAWDIAVTDDGPVVVEGNPYPGYYYQFPCHCPNKTGILPRFKQILGEVHK